MACPSDRNNGFVQITDAITQSALENISVNQAPFTLSFSPKGTIPKLVGNSILEDNTTDTICKLGGNQYSLIDMQICSVLHNGYLLPGEMKRPEADLILTFKRLSNDDDKTYAGVVICIPIYESNRSNHAEYLLQILKESLPSCDYKMNTTGSLYKGEDYKTIKDASISSCINSCCNDRNCLAYNFKKGTCSLKKSIQPLQAMDGSSMSGTVNHTKLNPAAAKCPTTTTTASGNKVSTLESIFYSSKDDVSQTSFSYKTCFEIVQSDNTLRSHNLAVFVFPRGIELADGNMEQLKLQLNFNFVPYKLPPSVRLFFPTAQNYRFGPNGDKIVNVSDQSKEGFVYKSSISSCTNEFKNRFEYFTLPPKLQGVSFSNNNENAQGLMLGSQAKTNLRTTEQYKCVPFNQLTDLNGSYVIPGNKTLGMILNEKNEVEKIQNKGDVSTKSFTTDEIENYVAIGVGGAILLGIAIRGFIFFKNGGK
jgi:hypothetical protein